MVIRPSHTHGFTLLEVLAAVIILSTTIIALSQNQTQSMQLIQTAQYYDKALFLAQSKMAEIDRSIQEKGLSALKDEEKGEFDQETYPGYTFFIKKEKIPVPDFAKLMSMTSGDEVPEDDQESSGFEGPLKMITELWGKAIRQVTVEVTWKVRSSQQSYDLVTHYVEKDVFGQVQGLLNSLTGSQAGGQEESENQTKGEDS